MDWLLNDKEMLEVVSNIPANIKPDKSVTIFLQAECQAIARAEAKKLVGQLERAMTIDNNQYDEYWGYMVIAPEDWQALKKDLGF